VVGCVERAMTPRYPAGASELEALWSSQCF
jgi:hypothetical protein